MRFDVPDQYTVLTLILTYVKLKINMLIQPISVKYLRENFSFVRERLKNGSSFLLIYRSEPIARIEPIKEAKDSNKILRTLLNPPKTLQFKTNKSAVTLVRKVRD